jgi:proteic killer suppression protein
LDLFRERNTRAARRIPHEIRRIAQRKLKALDVAVRLDDLTIPAGNRLEALKGDQAGRHSIRINDQYRVTFRWEHHGVLRPSERVTVEFILAEKAHYPVRMMSAVLDVSPSSYYAWRGRPLIMPQVRADRGLRLRI